MTPLNRQRFEKSRRFPWGAVTLALVFLAGAAAASARELAGVTVPDATALDGGDPAVLNGAGVRAKFLVDVYVAALYLPRKTRDAASVLSADTPKRMTLHFVRDLDGDAIVTAWNDGFAANSSATERAALRSRIDQFNAAFPALKRGDVVTLDFARSRGTRVAINGETKSVIAGADFAQALFAIWLGAKPISAALKQALLTD